MATHLSTAAADVAREKLEKESRAEQKEAAPQGKEPVRFVSIRLKESDHVRLGILAAKAHITKAAFAQKATSYIMDMVEADAMTINNGVIIDRRQR
jgi:hypothetical protein